MGYSIKSLDDSSAESYALVGELQLKRFQKKTTLAIGLEHISCDILAKTVTAFFSCPKNLPEGKFKRNGLFYLLEKISRRRNIESVVWLVLLMHVQPTMKKEQA